MIHAAVCPTYLMAASLNCCAQPPPQDIQRVFPPIAVPYAVGLPASDLVNNVCWAFHGSKSVTHRVPKAMHCGTFESIGLQPFVQGSTGSIRLVLFRLIIPRKSKARRTRFKDALRGPKGRTGKRNSPGAACSLQPSPRMRRYVDMISIIIVDDIFT